MSRLWVRISLGFAVILAFYFIMVYLLSHMFIFSFGESHRKGSLRNESVDIVEMERHRIFLGLIGVVAFCSMVGVSAGVYFSRQLTQPLDELVKAASELGNHQWRTRVRPHGSQEFIEVADAFNQMASDLEEAEITRRNLTADVAHELRHPLMILQGNLRAILDDVYLLNKEEVARIYEQSTHLELLIDDLNELAQAQAKQLSLHFSDIEPSELIHSAVEVFLPLISSENLICDVSVAENLPRIPADRARLTQVIHNLILNAMQHTPSGGKISISAQLEDDSLRINITDTGEGIPAEDLAHVFERYYRSDRSRIQNHGGTGLGLAIVKALVELHHGHVCVYSNPGGSTFQVFLPIIDRGS